MPRGNGRVKSVEVIHVRCSIKGEPAQLLRELKERGIVSSVRGAVVQGILALYEETLERDLKRAQVGAGFSTHTLHTLSTDLPGDETRQGVV